MVNFRALFAGLSGETFSYSGLRHKLSQVISNPEVDVPAEISVRDLFNTAQANGWIRKIGPDQYEIIIPETQQAIKAEKAA